MVVKFSRGARKQLPIVDATQKPFTIWLPDSAIQTLHRVDRSGGSALGVDVDNPEIIELSRDRMLIDAHMEEAIATSQIEGAVTTRRHAKEMLRTGRKPKDRSEQMVANGYRTISMLRERTKENLSTDLLHDIQRSMTEGTLDDPGDGGRFRGETKTCALLT